MKTKQQSLGSRLVRLRSRRGWTQQQLANVAGLSRVQVARLETGARGQAIWLRTLQRLAEAVGVTLEELTGTQRCQRRSRSRSNSSACR